MSDGPYRSLPLRSKWKLFAKTAANSTYDDDDLNDAATRAVIQDAKKEWSPTFLRRMNELAADPQGDFLQQRLDAARREAAGYPLAIAAVGFAELLLQRGHTSDVAVPRAMELAASERVGDSTRQTEEHYRHETSARHANAVRERMERGISNVRVKDIALAALAGGVAYPAPRRKKDGLDEGAPLR